MLDLLPSERLARKIAAASEASTASGLETLASVIYKLTIMGFQVSFVVKKKEDIGN